MRKIDRYFQEVPRFSNAFTPASAAKAARRAFMSNFIRTRIWFSPSVAARKLSTFAFRI